MRTPCLVIKTLDIPQMLPFINSKGSYSELFTFLVPKFGAVVRKLEGCLKSSRTRPFQGERCLCDTFPAT